MEFFVVFAVPVLFIFLSLQFELVGGKIPANIYCFNDIIPQHHKQKQEVVFRISTDH